MPTTRCEMCGMAVECYCDNQSNGNVFFVTYVIFCPHCGFIKAIPMHSTVGTNTEAGWCPFCDISYMNHSPCPQCVAYRAVS